MPAVTFVSSAGRETTVDAELGQSLLAAALAHDIEGILGECGGSLACGTCHVYVEPRFFELLAPIAPDEQAMLDFSSEPRPNSRLCCQLVMTPALQNLILRVPELQP